MPNLSCTENCELNENILWTRKGKNNTVLINLVHPKFSPWSHGISESSVHWLSRLSKYHCILSVKREVERSSTGKLKWLQNPCTKSTEGRAFIGSSLKECLYDFQTNLDLSNVYALTQRLGTSKFISELWDTQNFSVRHEHPWTVKKFSYRHYSRAKLCTLIRFISFEKSRLLSCGEQSSEKRQWKWHKLTDWDHESGENESRYSKCLMVLTGQNKNKNK